MLKYCKRTCAERALNLTPKQRKVLANQIKAYKIKQKMASLVEKMKAERKHP